MDVRNLRVQCLRHSEEKIHHYDALEPLHHLHGCVQEEARNYTRELTLVYCTMARDSADRDCRENMVTTVVDIRIREDVSFKYASIDVMQKLHFGLCVLPSYDVIAG